MRRWGLRRTEAALTLVTCGEVERRGLPARRVAAVHLLGGHQPLDTLHVPITARLEQLAGGRLYGLGRRARAGRAPAGAATARHDPGRRGRQQQRQQREQEPRPREQEGEAPRRRRAQGPGRSAPCCHRAPRSPMAGSPSAPPSAPRPPTTLWWRRQGEPAPRTSKRCDDGSWQGPSRHLLGGALGTYVTSRRACAVAGDGPGWFRRAEPRGGVCGKCEARAFWRLEKGLSPTAILVVDLTEVEPACLLSFLKEWISRAEFSYCYSTTKSP